MDEDSSSVSDSSISECDSELEESMSGSSTFGDQQYGAGEKRRRKQSSKTYFEGQSRMPYRLSKRLRNSMDGNETILDGVCKQCNPALVKIVEGFRKLTHQGSELKKRKKKVSSS